MSSYINHAAQVLRAITWLIDAKHAEAHNTPHHIDVGEAEQTLYHALADMIRATTLREAPTRSGPTS